MTEARLYLLGAGTIAKHHASAFRSLPGGENAPIAAADPSEDARRAFQADFPDARAVADVESLLAEPATENDVAVVAAPPFTHRDLAVRALESGRHVLCEKPLAVRRDEADAMVTAATENDRLLGSCSCRFLGTPSTSEVARLLADGALGEVYQVTFRRRQRRRRSGIEYQPESRWFLDRSKAGGGILLNWGPYDVTVLNHLFDPDRVVVRDAWTAQPAAAHDLTPDVTHDVEHHVGASLRYERSDRGSVPVSYERSECTHGPERTTFEIEGTDGALRWDWTDDESGVTLATDSDGEVVERTVATDERADVAMLHRPLVYFDRAIRGEPAPIPTNERAASTLECLTAIYRCAETGDSQSVTVEGEP